MNILAKLNALRTAWSRVTGNSPPNDNSVRLALAQAIIETHAGDSWPLAHNWGATDYRAPNMHEQASIQAGMLNDGMWLYPDGSCSSDRHPGAVAQLHTDTRPGGIKYHMWFAAFEDDVAGATYFLRIVLRMAAEVLNRTDATATDYATSVYQHGYFEGFTPGARPVGQRTLPLTAPEEANVSAYAKQLDGVLPSIIAAQPPADVADLNPLFVPPDPTPDTKPPDDAA